nr:serine hydrolase domain-containing protein [Actinopolymorpha rutila]
MVAATAAPVAATPAAAATTEPAPRELQSALDRIVDAGAIGAVAEIRDRHGVVRGHSGVAALDTHRAVPVQSRFRIGSITKTFVATVTLQLVDEGRLNLNDTVEKWLPGVVPGGDKITLRYLLNHTSGLYDYLHTLTFPPDPAFLAYRSRTWTAEELIHRAVSNPPVVKDPGKQFSYSNTNYILLGEIIEKATGRTYGEEIERRIIRPLRLRGTTVPGTSEQIPGPHPHGYVPVRQGEDTQLVDYTEMNPSVMGAGGEIISTTSDLNRFYAALFGGRLVPSSLLDEMTEAGTDGGRYGLGLFIVRTTCGITVYGHDRDALAYDAWAYSTKDGRRQVAIAVTPDHAGNPDEAVDALVDAAFCG